MSYDVITVSSKEMMEDQGAKLRQILISKDSFKEAYLVRGASVRIFLKGDKSQAFRFAGVTNQDQKFF